MNPPIAVISRLCVWIIVIGVLTLSILILSSCATHSPEYHKARLAARLLSRTSYSTGPDLKGKSKGTPKLILTHTIPF